MSCQAQTYYRIPEDGPFEIAVTFDAARSNTTSGYDVWSQGGSIQSAVRVTRYCNVVADFSMLRTGMMPHTTVELDLVSSSLVRVTPSSLCAGGSVSSVNCGVSYGSNGVFPGKTGTATSASGSALVLGGGVDYQIGHRVSDRVVDSNWLRTSLSNGTTAVQNNLRFSPGLTLRF